MRRRELLAAPVLAAPVSVVPVSVVPVSVVPWAGAFAQGAGPVDLLLVLAVDASGSISPEEFVLQRQGYAEALTSPAVLDAVRAKPRGIGIAMVEWGSPLGAATVVGWHRVTDGTSARAFAEAVTRAERSRQSWNAIGDALMHAGDLLRAAPFAAGSRVVDLSGDGPDMRGAVPAARARDLLVEEGVTVNALALAAEGQVTRAGEPLAEHYRAEVIGGPGAFVVTAEDRRDLARALRAKLVREIA